MRFLALILACMTGHALAKNCTTTWNAQNSNTVNTLNDIHWDGQVYIAVGDGGAITTSPDGLTWTLRASGTTLDLTCIASNSTHLVVRGRGGVALSSDDHGVTWTVENDNDTDSSDFTDVTWAETRFLAVSEQGDLSESPDGVTWSNLFYSDYGTSNRFFGVGYANGRSVAVGYDIPNDLYRYGLAYYQDPGDHWRRGYPQDRYIDFQTMADNDQIFLAVDDSDIYRSSNGDFYLHASGHYVERLRFTGNRFLGAGYHDGFVYSEGGALFRSFSTGIGVDLHSVASNGTQAVVVGDHGGIWVNPDITTLNGPTAVVGSGTACPSVDLRVDLTGTPPWRLVWADGHVQDNIMSSPVYRTVTPPQGQQDSYYLLRSVSDSLCEGSVGGSGHVYNFDTSATLTGDAEICTGGTATLSVRLRGIGPFEITWSDGLVENTGFQHTRVVSPTETTVYTITSMKDYVCDGGAIAGSATVFVEGEGGTATVSGGSTICEGDDVLLQLEITGAGPWDVIWSDGFFQEVEESPATRTVSPFETTIYTLDSVSNRSCDLETAGTATVTVYSEQSATLSGASRVCEGESTSLTVVLAGAPPWSLTWSDGLVQSDIQSSPVTRMVTPLADTTYTVIAGDTNQCREVTSQPHHITVDDALAVEMTPRHHFALGLAPPVLDASLFCPDPGTILQWSDLTHGIDFGEGVARVVLDPLPTESTDYRLSLQNGSGTVNHPLRLLVSQDPLYLDHNGDGCNGLDDLYRSIALEWRAAPLNPLGDPNNDGRFNVLDLLYINTGQFSPCL